MIQLLGIVLASARFNVRASITACVIGIVAFDYLFIPPAFTISPNDIKSGVIFVAMLVVAVVISTLNQRLREQEQLARAEAFRAKALFALSHRIVARAGHAAGGRADRTASRSTLRRAIDDRTAHTGTALDGPRFAGDFQRPGRRDIDHTRRTRLRAVRRARASGYRSAVCTRRWAWSACACPKLSTKHRQGDFCSRPA
jgi:hypothetical protein